MSLIHHQATVTKAQELAVDGLSHKHNSVCYLYETNFTFPSDGAEYYAFDSKRIAGDFTTLIMQDPTSTQKRVDGYCDNFIFDWEGGGPEGIKSSTWQTLHMGCIWGMDSAISYDVTFRLTYSGSVYLSIDNDLANYNTNLDGNLSTVLVEDWTLSGNTIVDTTVSTTLSGSAFESSIIISNS